MTPLFHPHLVNGPFDDPGLYIEFLFEKRAMMFDLGDISSLSNRKILRITDVFVSHAHMDHFIGFDRMLRIKLGRSAHVRLFGPAGFLDRLEHRLSAYTWNLAPRYRSDLVLTATELHADSNARTAVFQLSTAFRRDDAEPVSIQDGILHDEDGFRVRATILDHQTPCLAFALEEGRHVNIHKTEVEGMGFRVGPWLRELRQAVLRDEPDETPIRVWWRDGDRLCERHVPLGQLKARLLRIVPGQKIAYVTDAAYHDANVRRIVALARNADTMFIEAAFLDADTDIAAAKHHLTARQAGSLARQAEVRVVVPFHFSTRYSGRGDELMREVLAAAFPEDRQAQIPEA